MIARLARHTRGIPVVAASAATLAALRQLDAARIALVSPPWFDAELDSLGCRYYESAGFEVLHTGPCGLPSDQARITPSDLYTWVCTHMPGDADAVVIGGNGLRAVGVIAPLEHTLERPVLTATRRCRGRPSRPPEPTRPPSPATPHLPNHHQRSIRDRLNRRGRYPGWSEFRYLAMVDARSPGNQTRPETREAVSSTPARDALIHTIGGGMRLRHYLPTRTFELVVHRLDITAATGLQTALAPEASPTPPDLPPTSPSNSVKDQQCSRRSPAAPNYPTAFRGLRACLGTRGLMWRPRGQRDATPIARGLLEPELLVGAWEPRSGRPVRDDVIAKEPHHVWRTRRLTVSIGRAVIRVGDSGAGPRPAQPDEARRHECPSRRSC
jgi:hypothetical protein